MPDSSSMKQQAFQIAAGVSQTAGNALNLISDLTGLRAVIDPLPHPRRAKCKTLVIPGYKQVQNYTCGFIAAANVLHLFSPEADLHALYAKLDDHEGTTETEVASALRLYGVAVRRRTTLDFPSLRKALRSGAPIICSVQSTFHGHWVVVYGYDSVRESVFVCGNGNLPVLNRKEVNFERFCEKWDPSGNGLVCTLGRPKQPRQPRRRLRVHMMKK